MLGQKPRAGSRGKHAQDRSELTLDWGKLTLGWGKWPLVEGKPTFVESKSLSHNVLLQFDGRATTCDSRAEVLEVPDIFGTATCFLETPFCGRFIPDYCDHPEHGL